MVYGLWFMVYRLWFIVYGLWFMEERVEIMGTATFKLFGGQGTLVAT
jgi:hypothetical protein